MLYDYKDMLVKYKDDYNIKKQCCLVLMFEKLL